MSVPAGPVSHVVDANHAGESFTAGFLGALLEQVGMEGLRRGAYAVEAVREAAWQGSLAAALELGIRELAFPSRADVLALRSSIPTPWG